MDNSEYLNIREKFDKESIMFTKISEQTVELFRTIESMVYDDAPYKQELKDALTVFDKKLMEIWSIK